MFKLKTGGKLAFAVNMTYNNIVLDIFIKCTVFGHGCKFYFGKATGLHGAQCEFSGCFSSPHAF